jgi:hypothetical protein
MPAIMRKALRELALAIAARFSSSSGGRMLIWYGDSFEFDVPRVQENRNFCEYEKNTA